MKINMKKFFYLLILILIFNSCSNKKEAGISETYSAPDLESIIKNEESFLEKQKNLPKEGEEIAIIKTNYGDIKLKFFKDEAPLTVNNFKKLVKEDFYDNLTFHRIIPNFMIQGGDPEGTGQGGPGYQIKAEISNNLSHIPGAVATARLPDQVNPEKKSSGSQFYIVHGNSPNLDLEYTIFGQVYEGLKIVDKIANLDRKICKNFETKDCDKPLKDVIITDILLDKYQTILEK
jgi:cyclophilin family peptidyl-prolyl cis-trans isomerase